MFLELDNLIYQDPNIWQENLDDVEFNPRGWNTGGVNEDNIIYNDNIKINNLTDETRR